MLKEVVGRNISSLRKEMGWTKKRLSQAIGISALYLRSIERGEANITVEILERAVEVFGVSPAELVTLKEERVARQEVAGSSGEVPSRRPKRREQGRVRTTRERIIRFFRRHEGEVTITVPKLAKEIKRSERAAWKELKSLCASGEVVVIKRGGGRGKGNTFRLVKQSEVVML
jgi:transcriptional regulator with XRE-family HTH domain